MTGKDTDKAKSALDMAREWLENYLADGKPVLKETVLKAGAEMEYSKSSIERAKKKLPITNKMTGGSRSRQTWALRATRRKS